MLCSGCVQLEPQAVGDMTVEELLRSFFAARANTMEVGEVVDYR